MKARSAGAGSMPVLPRPQMWHDPRMEKPPGAGTAPQPRRPAGALAGRGGQWSPKPVADMPAGGGVTLGEDGASDQPAAVDIHERRRGGRRPGRRNAETAKLKLAGPRVDGRRLQVTVRRDPDTGAWVNPTMFGDETFRMLSDAPWDQGGAEEAKGLHAQVFVDMLNAGDALPCPEHAKAALIGTQEAGYKWAGWGSPNRAGQVSRGRDVLEIAAATRAEIYFRDRLLLWSSALPETAINCDTPIIHSYDLHAAFWGGNLWLGEDGRLLERLVMLEDNNGRSVMDRSWRGYEALPRHDEGLQLPVCLLRATDLDPAVKRQCFKMLELARQISDNATLDWVTLFWRALGSGRADRRFSDTVISILRHYKNGNYHPVKGDIVTALIRLKRSGRYPDTDLVTSDAIEAEIDHHIGAESHR